MVTTSISATENNAERSVDVDILLMSADATRYVTVAMFTRSTSTFRGFGSKEGVFLKKKKKNREREFNVCTVPTVY